MKTLIKILVLLLFPIIGLTQQTDINYNFSNHAYTENPKIKKLKQGDFYRLKIQNINLNVYRVEVETKDSTTYKPIDFSSFVSGGSNLTALFAGITNSLSSLSLNDAERKSVISFNEQLQESWKSNSMDFVEIAEPAKELDKLINELTLISKEGALISSKIELEESKVKLRIKKASLLEVSGIQRITPDFIDVTIANFLSINKSTQALKQKADPLYKEYEKLYSRYKESTALKEKLEELTKAKNDLVKAINKLDANSNETYRNKLATKLYDYVNNSETTYTSMPIQLTKDMANISFKIVPIDSGSRLPSYHSTLNVPGTRQWYWAVGAGGYYSNLYDEHYSLSGVQLTDSTAAYKVISEDVNPADTSESVYSKEFGASVGLKVGYRLRSCPGIGFHGSLGSGFSFTKNVRPRLMLGIGASFGYKHRLTLDAGWIAGYTERLSRAYSGGITIAEPVERVTVSKVQHGYFIGVGYVFVM